MDAGWGSKVEACEGDFLFTRRKYTAQLMMPMPSPESPLMAIFSSADPGKIPQPVISVPHLKRKAANEEGAKSADPRNQMELRKYQVGVCRAKTECSRRNVTAKSGGAALHADGTVRLLPCGDIEALALAPAPRWIENHCQRYVRFMLLKPGKASVWVFPGPSMRWVIEQQPIAGVDRNTRFSFGREEERRSWLRCCMQRSRKSFQQRWATMVGIKYSFREKSWTVSRRRHKHQVEASRIMIKPRFEFEPWDEEWRAPIKGAVRLQNTRL